MSDSITIIRARNRRLAKLVHQDGHVDGYDLARTFDLAEHPVADLAALADVLRALLARWDCAVVRGAILDTKRALGVRRLLHFDAKTGDLPTLSAVARRWLALDMEGIARPAAVPLTDLLACYRLAVATLPAAFADAACIVAASGSHGIKPGVRLRLWFWCDRPVGGEELKRWLRDTPADPSVFGAAQPIYTAAPVIAGGAPDPLVERIIAVPGAPLLVVPSSEALAPPPRSQPSTRPIRPQGASRYVEMALIRAAATIANAPKRHPRIIGECCGLARLVRAGLLTEGTMRAVVTEAARRAGKEDASEIGACLVWGLANPSTGAMPEIPHGS